MLENHFLNGLDLPSLICMLSAFCLQGELCSLVETYLQMFLLVGIRVHKHAEAGKVVHISKHGTFKRQEIKL